MLIVTSIIALEHRDPSAFDGLAFLLLVAPFSFVLGIVPALVVASFTPAARHPWRGFPVMLGGALIGFVAAQLSTGSGLLFLIVAASLGAFGAVLLFRRYLLAPA